MKIFKRRPKENASGFDKELESSILEAEELDISLDNIELELNEDKQKNRTSSLGKVRKADKSQQANVTLGNSESIEDICTQAADAVKVIQEAKLEYKAVTDYLADIQKIDRMEGKDREDMEDAARNIITLTRERSKYQTTDIKLSDVQFRNISRYDNDMLREIKNIRKNEDYQRKVKGDLRQLDAEKVKLEFEKNEILKGQEMLRKLAFLSGTVIVIMNLVFLYLYSEKEMNLKVPFILSVVLGAAIAFFVFYESRRNRQEMLNNGKKRNKLVGLTNKVKIKYVNTQNALDYAYDKFMVNSSDELSNIYDKYVKAKREAEQYRSNTGMLNLYNNQLIRLLDSYYLKDSEIWIYQAVAIIDNKEMVEIRHRLNERRQKLRERIEFNYKVQDESVKKLELLKEKKPELGTAIEEAIKKYQIDIFDSL